MHEPLTIENLVSQLAACDRDVTKIISVLGQKTGDGLGGATVQVRRPPFETATVLRENEEVNIDFILTPGSWHLSDVTEAPEKWRGGTTPLPDSGRLQVYRDWDFPSATIRCVAQITGTGKERGTVHHPDYNITGVSCQVSPP